MSGYRKRIWQALAVQAAGALAAVAIILPLVRQAPRLPLALVMIGLMFAGALLLAAGQPWWRRIDEMEREEHAIAWYEGSIPGALVVLMGVLGLTAHTGAHRELALGAAVCFIGQGLFYLVFFAIRRRARTRGAVAR